MNPDQSKQVHGGGEIQTWFVQMGAWSFWFAATDREHCAARLNEHCDDLGIEQKPAAFALCGERADGAGSARRQQMVLQAPKEVM